MSKALFSCIGNSLEKLLTYHLKHTPVSTLIAVGGVMSNSILRNRLNGFCHKNNSLSTMLREMLMGHF